MNAFSNWLGRRETWLRFVWVGLFLIAQAFSAGCTRYDPDAKYPLLTTDDLRQILGNPMGRVGIQYNRDVGLAFQKEVLTHLPGLTAVPENKKPFPSKARNNATSGAVKGVIPDAVTDAAEGVRNLTHARMRTYPESTFIEVKAVKGVLDVYYGRSQLLGMIDALASSPAASSTGPDRAYPSLYLITTLDGFVTTDLEEYATQRQVLLWLSWIEMLGGGLLRVTKPVCANCIHVFHGRQEEDILFPGLPFTISFPGAKVVPRLIPRPQDEAILDDRLIGFPGIPGDTSPNP